MAFFCLSWAASARGDDTNLSEEVSELREQNLELKAQIQRQNDELSSLSQRVNHLELPSSQANPSDDTAVPTKGGLNFGKVNLSGEGGVAFFKTGPEGFTPDSDFRVDEARLFVEASIWNEVYFYNEIDLATRENPSTQLYVNELYLDFQDVSQLWGRDSQLNFRAGRVNIPFGEEYLMRYAIDDPLISHSISDLWGIDPGVEVYGSFGKFGYVAAVQDGGIDGVQSFSDDKSVAGRIGYDPDNHWHFSVSAMRTGNLSVDGDGQSGLWIGNGFFRSLGSPDTTKFHADLVEGDVTARWKSGRVSALGGYARYGDNDPSGNNARNIFYYSVESMQNLPMKFFVAARFSQMLADQGFPMVGYGNFDDYYQNTLTKELWRLSLGLGYRFSDDLIIKLEYSFERGRALGGGSRDQEDFLGTEAVFKF